MIDYQCVQDAVDCFPSRIHLAAEAFIPSSGTSSTVEVWWKPTSYQSKKNCTKAAEMMPQWHDLNLSQKDPTQGQASAKGC